MVIKVLVVDDDESMGETLAIFLNRSGFFSTSRTSAKDALVLLESSDFDVIITDLNMDEMTGIELCARVAVSRPGLPVIVMTGLGVPEARLAALAAGARGFLTKPVDVDVLRGSIEQAVLARRSTLPVA
jgi:DNA-binding NtrC family response regulator